MIVKIDINEIPLKNLTPNEILGEVYAEELHPGRALWALESRERYYRNYMNTYPYDDETLYDYEEIERVIKELRNLWGAKPIMLPGVESEVPPLPEPAPDIKPPEPKDLTDKDYIERLEGNGFLMENEHCPGFYIVKKGIRFWVFLMSLRNLPAAKYGREIS